MTLESLLKDARALEELESDVIVSTADLWFDEDEQDTPDYAHQGWLGFAPGMDGTPLTEHAAVQMSGMLNLGSSARITRQLHRDAPGALGHMWNMLLDKEGYGKTAKTERNKGLLFRLIGQTEEYNEQAQVRAIMGKNWTPHKNSTVIEELIFAADGIKKTLATEIWAEGALALNGVNDVTVNDHDNPIAVVRANRFGNDGMDLFVVANMTVHTDEGDINPGMYVVTTQINRRTTRTGPATWKLICSNGARVFRKLRQQRGVFNPNIGHVISEPEFRLAFQKAIMNNLPSSVKAIEDHALSARASLWEERAVFDALVETMIPDGLRNEAVRQAEQGDSINGTPNTVSHLANSLTYIAHRVPGLSPDTREQLEMVAGTGMHTVANSVRDNDAMTQIEIASEFFRLAGTKLDEEELEEMAEIYAR